MIVLIGKAGRSAFIVGSFRPPRRNKPHRHGCGSTPTSPGCVFWAGSRLLEATPRTVFAREAPMPTPPAPRVHTSLGSPRPPRRNIPHRHRCGSTPRSPGCVFGTGSRRPAPPYPAVVVHEPCPGHARLVGPSLALTSASPSKLSGNTADTHVCDSSPTSPGCVFWSKIRLPEAAYGDVFAHDMMLAHPQSPSPTHYLSHARRHRHRHG